MNMEITEKKVLRFSLGMAVIGILILIMIYVIPIPMQEFKEESGFNRVERVDIKGTDLYFWISGSLWNTDRPDYVLPNDLLRYTAVFQTKKEYPIELHSDLIVYVGDKNVTNTITLPIAKFTIDERTNGINLIFHAKELGRNVIFANFKFINSTNNVVLEEFTMDTKYDVVSPEYALQDQSNKTTSVAFTASVFVGIFTVIALVSTTLYSRSHAKELRKQNKTLVKQNKELKEQTSIQDRPWLSLENEEGFSVHHDLFDIPFQNFGKSVAHDVKVTSFIKKGEITEDEIIKNGKTYPEFDVSPNEIFSHFIPIPENLRSSVNETDAVHIGLILEYKFERTKEGKSVLIAQYMSTGNQLLYKIKKVD